MNKSPTNERYDVNVIDSPSYPLYRSLAVVFSQMPVGQEFRTSIGRRFGEAIKDFPAGSFVGQMFHLDHRYTDTCSEVEELLGAMSLYGAIIGLENWGIDFDYRVTEKTHSVAQQAKDMGLFSSEEIFQLEYLGKRLIEDKELILQR